MTTWYSNAQQLQQYNEELIEEVRQLRIALKPFAKVADGIPKDWPGQCHLRVDWNASGEWLCYHPVTADVRTCMLPTIAEWRIAFAAAGGT